jgi:hypothetical protein
MNKKYYVENISATKALLIKLKETLSPLTLEPRMCTEESKFLFAKTCGWKNWEEMEAAHLSKETNKLPPHLKDDVIFANKESIRLDLSIKLYKRIKMDFPELHHKLIHEAVKEVWPDPENAEYMPDVYIKGGIYVGTYIDEQYERFIKKHILPTIALNGGVIFCYEEQHQKYMNSLVCLKANIERVIDLTVNLNINDLKSSLELKGNEVILILCKTPSEIEEHMIDERAVEALTEIKKHVSENMQSGSKTVKTLLLPYNTEFIPKDFGDFNSLALSSGWGLVAGGHDQNELTHYVEEEYLVNEWQSLLSTTQGIIRFENKNTNILKAFQKRVFTPVLYSKMHARNHMNIANFNISENTKILSEHIEKVWLS